MAQLEFNLLPEEFRRPEREVRLKLWAVVLTGVAVILVAFLILVYTGQARKMDELGNRINGTQAEIAKLRESVRLTEDVDRLKGGLEENIYAINALANQNAKRVNILQKVNQCVSPELSLVSLEERSQTYLVTGYANSHLTVARFIDNLKAAVVFQNVTLTYIRPTQVEGEDVLSFEITAAIGNTFVSANPE